MAWQVQVCLLGTYMSAYMYIYIYIHICISIYTYIYMYVGLLYGWWLPAKGSMAHRGLGMDQVVRGSSFGSCLHLYSWWIDEVVRGRIFGCKGSGRPDLYALKSCESRLCWLCFSGCWTCKVKCASGYSNLLYAV